MNKINVTVQGTMKNS